MDVSGHFGPQLRRWRTEADLSLAELARRTHYSKGYLSKIETGVRPPSTGMARRCDAALNAEGALMALVPPDTGEKPATPPARIDQDELWVLGMGTEGSVWFQPVTRRETLTTGAASLVTLGLAGPPSSRAQQQEAAVVAALSTVFSQVRALGQQASPRVVLPALIAPTHTLQTMAATASSRGRAGCYLLASRYAEYAGWMAQEAGHDTAALWWTNKAVQLASAGGDQELAAYALVRRALISLYAGDAVQTIALARRAQENHAAGNRIRGLAAQRDSGTCPGWRQLRLPARAGSSHHAVRRCHDRTRSGSG